MLAFLEGIVIYQGEEQIIVDVGGIGYEVFYGKKVPIGNKVALFTALIIRENSQVLYAFDSLRERNFFYLLLKVKGIGPKLAFGLLTSLGIEIISGAIRREDISVFMTVSGVGKKSASQIILDLKDAPLASTDDLLAEVLMATKALGIEEEKVISIYQKLVSDNLSSSEVVKMVLQRIN